MLPKTPAKGMRDFLPQEFALRQQILSTIQKTYEKYGFCRIETPSVENLPLLTSKQGGDNEKLIFKILKRGEKLENTTDGELCDLGLRYDLTVPLARFYSNNMDHLPSVFKAMQIDNVWRADRPQRGRFRQFVQCDIDVIGEKTNVAEIELILATSSALAKLGFDNVNVRISDRRLLSAIAEKCGFLEEQKSAAFIALDKLDKIGIEGVKQEMLEIAPQQANQFVDLIEKITSDSDPFACCVQKLGSFLPEEVKNNLEEILYVTNNCISNGKVNFDVTLVRGMGYYTGTIYEISVDGLSSSVAGGGRYDKMIGKISGCDVPACGFSIGFERIALLLSERKKRAMPRKGIAIVVAKDADKQQMLAAEKLCMELRSAAPKQRLQLAQRYQLPRSYDRVTVVSKIKNFSYQIRQLLEDGYQVYEYKFGELIILK